MLMAAFCVHAETEIVDGIEWTYQVSNGEAEIFNEWNPAIPTSTTGAVTIPSSLGGYPVTSIGYNAFYDCNGLTSITIPNSVTSIRISAFEACSGLTSITIPNSVTNIESSVFRRCSGLTSVTIPNSVMNIELSVFYMCSGLRNVTIPNSVTNIGSAAFYMCSSLTSVTIPKSVTSIGHEAFNGCSGLTSVTIPDSVTSIGSSAFYGCEGLADEQGFIITRGVLHGYCGNGANIVIPNSVTNIGDRAFYGCYLTSITIPDSVTSIEGNAFFNCSYLTNVTIPESVTSIKGSSFKGCNGLADVSGFVVIRGVLYDYLGIANSIVIPNSVTCIADYAFWGCEFLTSVTIPDSVTDIKNSAFLMCASLECVEIPNSVTNIGTSAFSYCTSLECVIIPNSVKSIGVCAFEGCSSLASLVVPDSVMSIGSSAFASCKSLSCVTIPSSVTNIGDGAFSCCTSLASVTIPGWQCAMDFSNVTNLIISEGTTNIADYAFRNCTSLTSVTIPNSVTRIGKLAFEGCSGLTSVKIPNSVTSIGGNAFSYCTLLASVTLSHGINHIDDFTFYECSSLTNMYIPNSVMSIGLSAFSGTSLINLIVPDSVTSIGDSAFSWCSGLTNVTIPDGVMSIGYYAFGWCSSLTNVVFKGDAPNNIGGRAFDYCHDDCTAYVAKGSMGWGVDIPGTWKGIKIDYSTIWSTGFENYAVDDMLVGISGSHFLYAGCYSDDNESVVGSNESVTGFDESCGYASPFTDMGSNCFNVNTGTDPVWISPYPITADGKLGGRYVPELGETFVVDAIVQFSETPMGDTVSIGGMPDVQVDSGNGVSLASTVMTAQPTRLAIRHRGTVMHIDDKIALYKQEIYENGVYSAVWSLIAGVEADDGTIEDRNLVLESVDVLNPIPDPGYKSDGKWVRITVKAIHDIKSQRLEFELYLNGALAKSGGKTRFLPCPSAKDKTGISAIGFAGEGRVDNVVFSNELPPALATVTLNNGGSAETMYVRMGESIGELPVPVNYGYTFKGWWTAETGGELVTSEMVASCDIALYARWERHVVPAPIIESSKGLVFYSDSSEVTITCDMEGATIYYSDEGKTPKLNDTYLYKGSFSVTDTVTVKAVAVFEGVKSEYVTVTIEKKVLTIEDALDIKGDVRVEIGGSVSWNVDTDNSKIGDCSVKSGNIEHGEETWMTATVTGGGTLSFWSKVSCEHDDDNTYTWDRLMVYTNGVEVKEWRMDGESDWIERSITFANGENTVTWCYWKDESDSSGDDCVWIDGVTWTPAELTVNVGGEKSVVVPVEWIDSYADIVAAAGGDKVAAFQRTAANGRKVWECYVLGLDPTDSSDDFRITRFWMDGNMPKFEFNHTTDGSGNSFLAYVKPLGKAQLSDKWRHVPEGGNPAFRFFTVEVVPPGCESSIVDEGVQLWENGPYWAECNVGATKPEEYGYYFWWGDTVGYTNTGSGWISVNDGTSIRFTDSGVAASTYGKDNSSLLSAGYIDSTGNLVPAYDAATAYLGSPWRMPTKDEISALVNNCTTTWTTRNGVYGRLVTGKGAYSDKSIFIPAAGSGAGSFLSGLGTDGRCWSSTPNSSYSDYAWSLGFNFGDFYRNYSYYRYDGRSVRPVRDCAK